MSVFALVVLAIVMSAITWAMHADRRRFDMYWYGLLALLCWVLLALIVLAPAPHHPLSPSEKIG